MAPFRIKVEVIRTSGARETREVTDTEQISKIIGADVCDTVNLRDGRIMFVDDNGHAKGLPPNDAGTVLYHNVCRPGTTHAIVGDVVIAKDADFE